MLHVRGLQGLWQYFHEVTSIVKLIIIPEGIENVSLHQWCHVWHRIFELATGVSFLQLNSWHTFYPNCPRPFSHVIVWMIVGFCVLASKLLSWCIDNTNRTTFFSLGINKSTVKPLVNPNKAVLTSLVVFDWNAASIYTFVFLQYSYLSEALFKQQCG